MTEIAAAPFAVDPLSPAAMADAPAFYRTLRDHHPVYYYADYDTFFFSRFKDVWDVLRVGDNVFVATETNLPTPEFLRSQHNREAPPFMATDPLGPGPSLPSPWYEAMRGAHIAPLKPKHVATLAALVAQVTHERLNELLPRGHFDVVGELAGHVAASAVCHLFGLPLELAPEVLADVANATRPPVDASIDFAVFFARLKARIVPAVQARRRAGADGSNGLIDGLVNFRMPDGRPLGDDEIADQLTCVLIGGVESTPKVVGMGLLQLALHPDQAAAIRADPAANVPRAVEEMVRFGAPAQYTFRTAHRDVTVAGQAIRAGQRVACLLHSAARDPREFAAPDNFIWDRPIERMISFGLGQHHCIGKHLALLEARTIVSQWLARVPRWHFKMDEAVRNPSYFQRGWIYLPVVSNGQAPRPAAIDGLAVPPRRS